VPWLFREAFGFFGDDRGKLSFLLSRGLHSSRWLEIRLLVMQNSGEGADHVVLLDRKGLGRGC
jgi:hypothetical protein